MTTVDDMFPKAHLVAEDLHGESRVVKIKAITQKKMWDKKENAKVPKPVIYFYEYEKYCILKSVIAEQIAKALGTREIEGWLNQMITIFPTTEYAFGENWDVIRARAVKQGERGVTPLLAEEAPEQATETDSLKTNGQDVSDRDAYYAFAFGENKLNAEYVAENLEKNSGDYKLALQALKGQHTPK